MMTVEQVRDEIAIAATRIWPNGCGQIEYATLVDMQSALNHYIEGRVVTDETLGVAHDAYETIAGHTADNRALRAALQAALGVGK